MLDKQNDMITVNYACLNPFCASSAAVCPLFVVRSKEDEMRQSMVFNVFYKLYFYYIRYNLKQFSIFADDFMLITHSL